MSEMIKASSLMQLAMMQMVDVAAAVRGAQEVRCLGTMMVPRCALLNLVCAGSNLKALQLRLAALHDGNLLHKERKAMGQWQLKVFQWLEITATGQELDSSLREVVRGR